MGVSRHEAGASVPRWNRLGTWSRSSSSLLLALVFSCGVPPEVPKDRPKDDEPPPVDLGLCGPAEYQVEASSDVPGLCVVRYARGLRDPHGLAFAPDGALFVVSRADKAIYVFRDDDDYGVAGAGTVFAKWPATHGIAFHDGHLYASSETHVVRWKWTPGMPGAEGPPATVVSGIPPSAAGGESARPIAFDSKGRLIVASGAFLDVDDPGNGEPHTRQSLLKRFELGGLLGGGFLWNAHGQVIASGIRQATGIAVASYDRLWVTDLGRQSMTVNGKDVSRTNPADELNLVDGAGGFYGHPYCWTDWAQGKRSPIPAQHPDPDVGLPLWNNLRCNDPRVVRTPAWTLPPRSNPMGVAIVAGEHFPEEFDGNLVLAISGLNDVGGSVPGLYRLHADDEGNVSSYELLVRLSGASRPSGVTLGPNGALYFSDAGMGEVFRVAFPPVEKEEEEDGE